MPTTATTPTPTLAETCRALDTFVDNVRLLTCIRNDQCNGTYCNVTDPAVRNFISTANITLLPCNQPPAFRLSTSGSTVLDRVISQSVNISLPGGITLRVTLDHLTNAVGVGVSEHAGYIANITYIHTYILTYIHILTYMHT